MDVSGDDNYVYIEIIEELKKKPDALITGDWIKELNI